MKTLETLTKDDYIAFLFDYHGGKNTHVEVAKISFIRDNSFIVHFNYGHHSLAEDIKFDDVIAIGDNDEGTVKFKGWRGKFTLLKDPETLAEHIDD